ncbi:sensor histidine kinase [Rhodanobacter terrae]|uniref:Sensor histidine kinase n=1 Tax=Rhodanobacter terrae TaxID=418647 RepID=A0ABW0STS2_9GAMM
MNSANSFRMRLAAWLRPAPSSMAAGMRAAGHSPRMHALNLLWSFWLFLGPIFTHVGPGFWWSLTLGYPTFLLVFLWSCIRPSTEANGYVGAMVMLAGVSMPWNPAAWTYGVFACAMVPYQGSLYASMAKIALIQLVLVLEGISLHWPWFTYLILVGVCTSTGVGAQMGRINWDKTLKLRMSHDQIRRLAATAERERIGRDLHDLLGHTLSLITLKLELSRKLFDRDHAAARRELEEAEQVARHALAEVRSAVTGIRATDLAAELASARLLLESSRVHLDYGDLPTDLPGDVERALSLILREAVTNVARHADASQARIEMTRERGAICMLISDNGRGGIGQDGNGLCGMRERVRALAGTLTIESPRGRGTRLKVTAPLPILRLVETSHSPAGMPVDAALAATDSGQPAA